MAERHAGVLFIDPCRTACTQATSRRTAAGRFSDSLPGARFRVIGVVAASVDEVTDIDVELVAFDEGGRAIDGDLSADQTLDVVLTISNEGTTTLKNFRFENDAPLVIDPRSPGGARIASGPDAKLKLNLGELSVAAW